jgi:hypothetical protein
MMTNAQIPTPPVPGEPADETATINLGNINRGAALEAFQHELAALLVNIGDRATPATAKRSITLRVDFVPHEDRVRVDTTFACTSKLAATETTKDSLYIGRTDRGDPIALDSDPRQMALWPTPKPIEGKTIEFGAGKESR